MISRNLPGLTSGREDGGVLIFTVLGISLMFVGLTAMAVDSGHMVMVRNELQNSADAAALAGAGVLFNDDGSINTGANIEAEDLARENPAAGADRASGSTAVDKLDVVAMRGHWSFVTETFTQKETTQQLVGWQGMTAAQLDVDTDFINAVQVTTTREHTKAIFANFFGQNDHPIETDAVAYIGFAATVNKGAVDIPFAICREYLTYENGALACGVARSQNEGIETGGWTNFSQDRPDEECTSSNANTVNNEILADIPPCEGLNSKSLTMGDAIGSINGAVSSTWSMIVEHCFVDAASNPDCFQNDVKYNAKKPWLKVTLPIVDCYDDNYAGGACDDTKVTFGGVVTVDIIWMSKNKYNVPVEYEYDLNEDGTIDNDERFKCTDPSIDWSNCADPNPLDPALCWQEFQDTFGWSFVDPDVPSDNLPENETIYFAPRCDDTQSVGGVGKYNSGIYAAIPVLVE